MNDTPLRTIAIIVAAGSSERFGGDVPKPYMMLGNETVLGRTLRTFLSHPQIDGVRTVTSRLHHPLYKKTESGLPVFPCVMGGKTRQESVLKGLESIAHRKPVYVLIHDAARPLVSHALITRVLEALKEKSAVLPVLPVADTLKRIEGGILKSTLDRRGVCSAQTPQGFRFEDILNAHRHYRSIPVTDDIALAEHAGLEVGIVAGEPFNAKITTQDDFEFMQQLVKNDSREVRVGTGYDVHAFASHEESHVAGRGKVTVCGIKMLHPYRLRGNSDADVGLHAIVDALLGAIGEGDIGQHFAPDDPQWAGADSSRFLIHAYKLLKDKGGDIVNLDVTIIGESPKISPYREEMRARIADILKISPVRVNVKACTTEKLGFLGRGEGLAAQAVASVTLPVG